MSPSTPLIYAELLSNIRQISVITAHETPCDSTTKAELSEDGKQFTLHHHGTKTSLGLPGHVVPTTQLQRPALGSKELSWRLPVAGPAQRPDAEDHSNEWPWSAQRMKEDSEFSCQKCGTVIIRKGVIQSWRDLPSENWAEMMDFWHCHKPSDHKHRASNGHTEDSLDVESAEELVVSKGYGASTKFGAQVGVAFVDIATFLLSEADITGVKQASPAIANPSSEPKPESPRSHPLTLPVSCITCGKDVGYEDSQAEGIKIWKWALSKKSQCHRDFNSDDDYAETSGGPFFSAIISSLISAIFSSQAPSRLVFSSDPSYQSQSASLISSQCSTHMSSSIMSSHSWASDQSTIAPGYGSPSILEPPCFTFWVLFPFIRYSSSTKFSSESMGQLKASTALEKLGTAAMKVFYKQVSKDAAKSLADDPNVEEVKLPVDAMFTLRKALFESAQMLPASGRKFQDWNVGLLDRYEEDG